ncbi:hypothetical protein [Youxingia wuxianensis]|uniref:Uncharacterized protein n=1 Tax=Youxingia wuxianensis TaxID=2763678 RepID=A0A926ET09_9FIRM|nr:hypothetical protein [Youxingia wuxianensis]MBC8585819.1 hypothetical protein [Youxingia wuxianensis]
MNKAEKREKKKNNYSIVDFMRITKHFLKFFTTWIEEMEDPRNYASDGREL